MNGYILWNPKSDLPPTAVFKDQKSATRKAKEMAVKFGQPFYVCELLTVSTSVARTKKPTTRELSHLRRAF